MSIWDEIAEVWEDVWDFLDDPKYNVARASAKEMAAKYNLYYRKEKEEEDAEAFEELWGLTINASLLEKLNHQAAIVEVIRLIGRLPALLDRAPASTTSPFSPVASIDENGMGYVHTAKTEEKYVIFSDHHMLYNGSRQNYFVTSGNKDLYTEILTKYYAAVSYNLVENGDVEELIILEPVLAEIDNIGNWNWSRVFDYRNSKKIPQLRKIVRDNIDYYEALHDGFISQGRFFKITGNHDRDMCNAEFAATVEEILGREFPVACDVLLLRSGQEADFIICHGHQFDTACTPRFAAKAGESFSQASAWAFQGPDRIWRTQFDQMNDWLAGREPVLNNLVSDEPEGGGVLGESALQEIWDALGAAISNLNTERGWETLYGKNIAWNYFENEGDPQKCIDLEVKTGKRWFKFRHMNELRLVGGLEAAFGSKVPTLIAGHTHEPRLRPRRGTILPNQPLRVEWQEIKCYANSGSAGRFENLIWGIEIIEKNPILISWHRDNSGTPIRTVWEAYAEADGGFLRPASSQPLPELLSGAAGSEAIFDNLLVAVELVL
ncbi:MAG TPA: hypothetical protein PLP42_04140 [Acidobacteriota bacterium]|nr:hypothetical protein [Acidobacteriota bacterium]